MQARLISPMKPGRIGRVARTKDYIYIVSFSLCDEKVGAGAGAPVSNIEIVQG